MWTKHRLASQSGQVVKNSQNEAQKSLNERNQVRLQQKEGMEELVLEDFSAQEKEKTKNVMWRICRTFGLNFSMIKELLHLTITHSMENREDRKWD